MTWPPKPLPRNFPLTVHPKGYVVTVAGKTRWVCGRKPPKEALDIYARKLPAWRTNDTPLPASMPSPESPTLHFVLNRWLLDLRGNAQRGEMKGGTFQQYRASAKRIDVIAGHEFADDWTPDKTKALYEKLHGRFSEDFARRAIGHLRAAAREASDRGWCRPMRIGNSLVAKLTARPQARMKWKLYTREQIRAILCACTRRIRDAKGPTLREPWEQLKAMILLAINGGYGARELSELPRDVIDLDRRLIDYRRGKTGKDHIVPLWPETVRALRVVTRQRPDDELVFRTRSGNPWTREKQITSGGKLVRVIQNDNVAWAFNELLKPLKLKFSRQSFYRLKHLHCTTADAAGDPHATFTLAGHQLPGSKGAYVAVGYDRVCRVVEYIREHLILSRNRASHHRPKTQ